MAELASSALAATQPPGLGMSRCLATLGSFGNGQCSSGLPNSPLVKKLELQSCSTPRAPVRGMAIMRPPAVPNTESNTGARNADLHDSRF